MNHERNEISPFTLRAADALAAAVLRYVDEKIIDSRSEAADRLLDYAQTRCGENGSDYVNQLRRVLGSRGMYSGLKENLAPPTTGVP